MTAARRRVCDDAESGYVRLSAPERHGRGHFRRGYSLARADEYPTLPPGETYAPGQNSALLVVGHPPKARVTAQLTSPSSPSLNDSVSGDDGRVMTSKITCDPAEEGHSTTLTCTARVESCPNLFKMKWYAGDREVVACTSSLCGSPYTSSNEFNTSISSATDNSSFIISSLTISNVSRISPVNMDTQWTCAVCGDSQLLECNQTPSLWEILVDSITHNTTVNLTMPEAVHSCFPEAIDGSFPGNVTRCNCSLTSNGYPSGVEQWFRGDQKETNVSDGVLLVTKNDYLDQAYSCEAMSVLGRNLGSFLKVKFAVQGHHLPEQDAAPTAQAMKAGSVNSGVVAAAVVATAVVGAAVAVATLLIRRHLSKDGGFGILCSTAAATGRSTVLVYIKSLDISPTRLLHFHVRDLHLCPLFPEAPGAGKRDGLFPTESTPPNNDLEGPEPGLNDYQTLNEATSTFKPDHGPAGYSEAQVMLNPLYEDGMST
ncbi:hypothetical protein RRG08_048914 [Elysia crispata]|uniref:Ig-like domain-containing protein n=1 Tax=Elysia crispata TaxID=231223 RepID=A0AAE1DTC2_9GAST|nr:hypothetical protein RRG08_048914 [Elysia crispata]